MTNSSDSNDRILIDGATRNDLSHPSLCRTSSQQTLPCSSAPHRSWPFPQHSTQLHKGQVPEALTSGKRRRQYTGSARTLDLQTETTEFANISGKGCIEGAEIAADARVTEKSQNNRVPKTEQWRLWL